MTDREHSSPIPFLRQFAAGILDGSKTATIRTLTRGRHVEPWLPGDECVATVRREPFAVLRIDGIEVVRPQDITDADARACGGVNADTTRADLVRFYPSAVLYQIVRFTVVRPLVSQAKAEVASVCGWGGCSMRDGHGGSHALPHPGAPR